MSHKDGWCRPFSSYSLIPKVNKFSNQDTKRSPTKLVDILEKQGIVRSSLKFHPVDEDTIDLNRELAKIKKRSMQKYYHKVFKDKLDKNDCLKIDPIKLELINNYEERGRQED